LATGTVPVAAVTKCDGTVEGKTNAAALGTETACADNCDVANCHACFTDKTLCDKCKPDHVWDATAKLCKAIVKKHGSCKTANAEDKDDSCLSCDDVAQFRVKDPAAAATATSWKCLCKDGYVDNSAKETDAAKKFICVKCGDKVKTCNDKLEALTCLTATDKIAGTVCAAPPDAGSTDFPAGLFYNAADGTYKACDKSCKTCTGSGPAACKTCADITAPTPEPKEGDTNFKTYLKTVFHNVTSNTCYKDCPAGFVADAARAKCEPASAANSVLLSAIALIFSLFLIF